jgi:hypothetical protein
MGRHLNSQFPPEFCTLVRDSFALVQCWEPYHLLGSERGRMFEKLFCRYCERQRLPLSERPGSRTLCGDRSASGFNHESDAVVALPGFLVHVELKYLTEELNKNELLIFNQKGLDFLAAASLPLRRRPLYRLLLSGRLISQEARRFALQWGIVTVEPNRLPLPLIHGFAGTHSFGQNTCPAEIRHQLREEIPQIITPLQKRLLRLASLMGTDEPLLSERRMDRVLELYQLQFGNACWTAMDEADPQWVEERYDALQLEP